ncbi:MAG: glycosyltransferase family 39 protein [Solirubrobacteraceae bacterium]
MPRPAVALTVLAALLRLPTLGAQSLWLDETLTGRMARGGLRELFERVAAEEANPPLYYVVEWLWCKLAGTSEIALRLPSALYGIALVPVAYLIGERLASRRTGYALAALVAVNPLLVYYSQEARGYSAVALLCGLSLLFCLDALKGRGRSALLWWALTSALALGVHYFAVFPIALEALVLLVRRRREALPALALIGLAGAALAPLLLHQRGGSTADNVTAGADFAERAKGAATSWLVGERGAAIANLEWVIGGLLVLAVGLLALRASSEERRAAGLVAAIGGGALALVLLAALAGSDYLNSRNTLPLLVALLAVPAVGLGARAAGSLGEGLTVAVCAAMLAAVLSAGFDDDHARHNWRGVARELGAAPAGGRMVVVAPSANELPMTWYLPRLARVGPAGARVSEIAVVLTDTEGDPLPPQALAASPDPSFTPAGVQLHQRMLIARYQAAAALPVSPDAVSRWTVEHLGRRAADTAVLAERQP